MNSMCRIARVLVTVSSRNLVDGNLGVPMRAQMIRDEW